MAELVRGVIIIARVNAHVVNSCASESHVYAFPPIGNDVDAYEYRVYFTPSMDGYGDKEVLEHLVECVKREAEGGVEYLWMI